MGRQYSESGVFEGGQQHQHAVVGLVAGWRSGLLPAQPLIVQCRFIAMVAIRDEERLGTHDFDDVREYYWIGDSPQLLPESVVIRKVEPCRFPLDGCFKESDHDILRVRIEGPDWAKIRVAGFEQ